MPLIKQAFGKVFLVGAGPGDPDLITVRGLCALKKAQTVLYDDLIARDLLDRVKPGTELISVGKEAGMHTLLQDAINRLIWERARAGRCVVRLKGGDPLVLARGAEEMIFLAERGVRVEVIPGVSSALAVPACAGIPLTHRDYASSFAVVSGHRKADGSPIQVPEADTWVYLMAVSNLPAIVEAFRARKISVDLPCALIESGTTARQRVITGTLATIAEKARVLSVRPPAVFVAGRVVALRDRLKVHTPEIRGRLVRSSRTKRKNRSRLPLVRSQSFYELG